MATPFKVADLSLAAFGRKEIELAEVEMPTRGGPPERAPALDQKQLAGADHETPDSDTWSFRRVGRFTSPVGCRHADRRLKEFEPVAGAGE